MSYNLARTCSFRGVKPGEVFKPVKENLFVNHGSIVEDREGKVVRFRKELTPGKGEQVVRNVTRDGRTYVKESNQVSACVESGADAIFGLRDEVVVLDHIDNMLTREEV